MGHKDLNGDEEQILLLRREITVKIRVPSENQRSEALRAVATEPAVGGHFTTETPAAQASGYEFKLDKKWIIDPDRLRVGAKIGEGAHGKVYEGRYGDLSVAIKVLQRPETSEEQAKLESRFAREVDMMSRVQHRNLVKFIGACKDPVMAIVTELLPGRSLRKHLISLRPNQVDLYVAVNFALDIAHAMDCLHVNGIIHRDLKPDNLLLTADHKSVKLADFGLAREESVTEMMTAETGTYRWMAPELYSTVTLRHGDKKHYNNKVDVYSFAIVLWELLTNRMPFEGMSNLQAAYAAAFKNARPSLADGLPKELVFILQSCWAEDPNVRPTFGQIARMLTSFQCTLPEMPSPVPGKSCFLGTKESPNRRLVKDYPSDGGSPSLANKPKRCFLCFGQCFVSGQEEHLT